MANPYAKNNQTVGPVQLTALQNLRRDFESVKTEKAILRVEKEELEDKNNALRAEVARLKEENEEQAHRFEEETRERLKERNSRRAGFTNLFNNNASRVCPTCTDKQTQQSNNNNNNNGTVPQQPPQQPTQQPAVQQVSTEAAKIAHAQHARNQVSDIDAALERLAEAVALPAIEAGTNSDDEDDPDWNWDSDSESESDSDSDSDNATNTNNATAGANAKRGKVPRNRKAYKPPKNSLLYNYLREKIDYFKSKPGTEELEKGVHFFPPTTDPHSSVPGNGAPPRPSEWYKSTYWVYACLLFKRYSAILKIGDCSCIYCKEKGKLESKEYDFRPAYSFIHVVWIITRRLKCRGCGRTFYEFDSRFLATLPTTIVENFPFLTTSRGPAIHKMMLYHFAWLWPKGLAIQTYIKSFNIIYNLQYFQLHANYLDSLAEYARPRPLFDFDRSNSFIPFEIFHSLGNFNGITLSRSLFEHYLYRFLEARERYIQNSFQLPRYYDNGEVADHTHKFANSIVLPGRQGRVFEASYTINSMSGCNHASILTYGKGNDEIRPVIEAIRRVRLRHGLDKLERFEGDGGSDRLEWCAIFKEIKEEIRPYLRTELRGFPILEVKRAGILCLRMKDEINNWARAMIEIVKDVKTKIYYGFDAEWNYLDGTQELTRTFQLAFPPRYATQILVIDLNYIEGYLAHNFPCQLAALLRLPFLIPVGLNVTGDVNRLVPLGVEVDERVDLGVLARSIQGTSTMYSLQALSEIYLKGTVDKTTRNTDWSCTPLPDINIIYAATDAGVHLELFQVMAVLAEGNESTRVGPDNPLKEQDAVIYYANGRPRAQGTIIFLPAAGHTRKFGDCIVQRKKCLVRLDKVLDKMARPPCSYKPTNTEHTSGRRGYDRKDMTLSKIFENNGDKYQGFILVHVGSLKVPLRGRTLDDYFGGSVLSILTRAPVENESRQSDERVSEDEERPTSNDNLATRMHFRTSSGAIEGGEEEIQDVDYYEKNDDIPLSKDHFDIFHELDSNPLPRKSPVKCLINRLLIQSSSVFDEDDYKLLATHLTSKKGLRANPEKGFSLDDALMEHLQ
jgi:hypothetical protein